MPFAFARISSIITVAAALAFAGAAATPATAQGYQPGPYSYPSSPYGYTPPAYSQPPTYSHSPTYSQPRTYRYTPPPYVYTPPPYSYVPPTYGYVPPGNNQPGAQRFDPGYNAAYDYPQSVYGNPRNYRGWQRRGDPIYNRFGNPRNPTDVYNSAPPFKSEGR